MASISASNRGVTAGAIREFCRRVGVTKQDNVVEMELLEFCVRQDLESSAPRGMGVLDPLRVTITNFDAEPEVLTAPWHPQQPELGERELSFSNELYIEREDFAEVPPPKYKRLSPGELVRLRYGYIIRCDEVIKDNSGTVTELRCSYVETSRSGSDTSGLKPRGVIHWVDRTSAVPVRIRGYGRLFRDPVPDTTDLVAALNPESLIESRGLI